MSIFSGIAAVTSNIMRGIGIGFTAISSGVASTGRYLFNLATDGFYDSGQYTIGNHILPIDDTNRVSRKTNPASLFLNIILSPITYLPGLIVGATVGPFALFTWTNFYNFFNYTNHLVQEYSKPENKRKFKKYEYNGGPLKFFGVIGIAIGLTLGTVIWTTLSTLFTVILPNTLDTFFRWTNFGWNLAVTDEIGFDNASSKLTNDDRSILAQILGYIPLGIPLSAIAFTFATVIHTTSRIVVNNFKTVANSANFFIDKSLFDTHRDMPTPFAKQTTYQNILGLPGFVIGGAIGLAIGSIIIVGRIFIESGYNIYKWASKGYGLPLSDKEGFNRGTYKFRLNFNEGIQGFIKSIKLSWRENLLGAPGYILAPVAATIGLLVGSGVRIAIESLQSTLDTGTLLINRMVNYNNETTISPRKWYEPIIGFLGYPVGLIVAPFTTLYANYDSALRVRNEIISPILKTTPRRDDTRKNWVKILSAPGAAFGLIIGATIRVTVESYYKAVQTAKYMVKTSFIDNEFEKSDKLKIGKEPSEYSKYWGALGYIISGIVMTPVVAVIVIGRLTFTNADSAKREFANQVNGKLQDARKIATTDDERTERLKTAGKFGQFLGFIAGKFGIVSIESAVYFEYSFKQVMQTAAYEHPLHSKIILNSTENHSKLVGTLGLISGGIVGVIAGSVLVGGRIIYNTGASIKNITADMVRFVWAGETFNDINNSTMLAKLKGENPTQHSTPKDKRETTPFRLGWMGIPIGGAIGTVAALTVGSLRIIAQTVVTTWNDFWFYTRLSLPFGKSKYGNIYSVNETLKVKQNQVDEVLGVLGKISGFAVGVVGFTIGGTVRFIVDTFISISNAFFLGASAPPVNYNYVPKVEEDRELTDKILGIPGYIIGIPFAVIGYVGHITLRVVIDSFTTASKDIENAYIWSLGSNIGKYLLGNHKIPTNDTRSFGEKHGFGLPGHVIGGAIAAVVSIVVLSARYAVHQWRSLKLGFTKSANLSKFTENNHFQEQPYNNDLCNIQLPFMKDRTILQGTLSTIKYITGIPGLAIGAAFAATFVILPRYVIKFAKNNLSSFLHLSGSLLNLGGEAFYYKGVGGDSRSTLNKVCGAPGYLLALCTAGLVPVGNAFLKAVAIMIVVATAIPVALYKAYKIKTAPRFNGEEGPEKQRIKNLFSALVNGEFVPEKPISNEQDAKAATGGKGSSDFIRKMFCFNEVTYVEKLLDARLAYIDDETYDINDRVKKIKEERHRSSSIFNSITKEVYNNESDKEVDITNAFIKGYLNGENKFSTQRTKYQANILFFHGHENISSEREDELERTFGK